MNDIDRTLDIGQESLGNLKEENFVESMGVEYQNLMNEMKSGSRKPSAMKP